MSKLKGFKFTSVVGVTSNQQRNLNRVDQKAQSKKNMKLVVGSMDDYVKEFVGHSIDTINKR